MCVNVSGVIADVKVTQQYENTGRKPLEAIYVFPASIRAAVYDMKMTVGERTIVADIRKREDARKEYEAAKNAGKSTSLLEQQRPNVFQMNVANILPSDVVIIELKYTELLIPTDKTYEFVYPTVVRPRYAGKTYEETKSSDKWVKNPYLCEGTLPPNTLDITFKLDAGLPIQDIDSLSHKIHINYTGLNGALVNLDLSEQHGGNRDFIIKYRLSGGKVASGLLLY